ncbi:MAG TPA: MerR family transcriptional regulator [Anaerolineae bacterium]|nr:MerR family transcriptional regulator [Anaerolineae bacterium]
MRCVVLAESSHMTLKNAARMLGVHEQTLRSWERKGLIRMARLPGSQYRRVPVEEVRRLQDVLSAGTSTQGVRLEFPRKDAQSRALAAEEAEAVRTELVELENDRAFDEMMQMRRGRIWSP